MKRLMISLALFVSACGPDDLDLDGVVAEDDCDDLNAAVYPGAPEICDGLDNDCNGTVDDGASDLITYFADADGDRFGDAGDSVQACAPPAGFVPASGDCDDTNAEINEGMTEVCNEVDDNCDGNVDEGDAAKQTYYIDTDADQWGDSGKTKEACESPVGYVLVDGDCDDDAPQTHPGAVEVCDGEDNDCDDEVDDGAVGRIFWYKDADKDLFGAGDSVLACYAPEDTYVMIDGDCDDNNDQAFPGGTEICDKADNDCNGIVDDSATDRLSWYRDGDGDKYGDSAALVEACESPSGYVADKTDCNDLEDWSYPGADEVCDGSDNDCDTAVDEDAIDTTTWYADTDGDGAGDPDVSVDACVAPTGYVINDLDCDDDDGSYITGCFAKDPIDITPCGASGNAGPSQSDCDTEYTGSDLDGLVTVSSGVQSFTVPESGKYGITAWGAQGASPTSSFVGGKGAEMYGEFTLTKGDTIKIIVGQAGSRSGKTSGSGGGGGATWVENGTVLLMVAGGGGGTRAAAAAHGCDAVTGSYATTGSGYSSTGSGGCVAKTTALGLGGIVSSSSYGSAGGGYNGAGANDSSYGKGGTSYKAGGGGGAAGTCNKGSDGGFGGGGAGSGCWGGGGGGGYSGGDGGFIAGGGGSYNTGTSPVNTAGVQAGDGAVQIDRL